MADTGEWGSALLLGVVQGLTEFLPVSSSGHLVLFQEFFPVAGDEVLFDLLLHLGTLLPAVWFYRDDVAGIFRDALAGDGPWLERPGIRLAALVGVATLPTVAIALTFKDAFEALFDVPAAVGVAFAVTAGLLLATARLGEGARDVLTTPWVVALALGVAQGLAITPGISRSGATIATALLLGLDRGFAVKLSFLMSVPAILGAVVLKAGEVDATGLQPLPMFAGTVAATLSGYAALVLLVRLVEHGRIHLFAWYLFGVAAFALAVGAGAIG